MKVIIVGGGKSASNLIRLFLEHEVEHISITLIDKNLQTCQTIADEYGIDVLMGDGCNSSVLSAAGAEDADIFLALTGKDEENLIACQIAKFRFGINSAICRVNEPKNIPVIKKLGILNTFSSTMLLAKVLNQEVEHQGIRVVHTIAGTDKVIVEFVLNPNADIVDKKLRDIKFTKNNRVVLVIHAANQEVEAAYGETKLAAFDRVMMICSRSSFNYISEHYVLTEELSLNSDELI